MRAQFELPVRLLANQSGASSSSSSSHVRGHLPTADGERAHEKADKRAALPGSHVSRKLTSPSRRALLTYTATGFHDVRF